MKYFKFFIYVSAIMLIMIGHSACLDPIKQDPITLNFEKYHFFSESPSWNVDVFNNSTDSGIKEIANNTTVTLSNFYKYENGSRVANIRSEDLLAENISTQNQQGQKLQIKAIFKNPGDHTPAGKYSGYIDVKPKGYENVKIPVLVQVRSPGWFAMLIMLLGVVLSILINWWNTKGKKKTQIEMDIKRIRGILDEPGLQISKKCRDEIKDKLNKADRLLDKDSLEEAERSIPEIDKLVDTCKEEKKKAMVIIEDADKKIDKILLKLKYHLEKLNDTERQDEKVTDYIESHRKKLKEIEVRFDEGKYLKTENMQREIGQIDIEMNYFLDQDGIFSSLEQIETLGGDLEDLRKKLAGISNNVSAKSFKETAKDAVKKATPPSPERKQNMDKIIKAVGAIDQDKANVLSVAGQVGFENFSIALINMPDLLCDPTLSPTLRDLKTGEQTARLPSVPDITPLKVDFLEAMPSSPQKYGTKILWKATPSDPARENLLYRFIICGPGTKDMTSREGSPTGWTKKNEWIWTPSKADMGENKITVQIKGPNGGNIHQFDTKFEVKDKDYIEKFWQWWTPERTKSAFSFSAYLLVIIVLAIMGYSKLYASNPIFGATNFWESHLYLFLWGFGVESATANVAGVRKAILG